MKIREIEYARILCFVTFGSIQAFVIHPPSGLRNFWLDYELRLLTHPPSGLRTVRLILNLSFFDMPAVRVS